MPEGIRLFCLICLSSIFLIPIASADGPADNIPEKVRRVPPLGVVVSEKDREDLELKLHELRKAMAMVKDHPLLPDVEIFYKAVHDALKHQEFQKPQELKWAREQLERGLSRAFALHKGLSSWMTGPGLVVRGFRSRIDGSVQPYGLVIPKNYLRGENGFGRHRLDFWFHGRGERTNEVAFIQQRLTQVGQYAPAGAFVLHPYARYSNANKFAGEIDCLEALEHAKKHYRIDEDRILVRGFSMGGAACWQFAVHYADRWAAANPGAGFSETPEFLRTFQGETLNPSWYEKKLWHLYDCTDYAQNLYHLPTVAYSGERDRQKQAADIMMTAMLEEDLLLQHIIGPKTEHKIHPDSKKEIERRLDSIAAVGRDRMPRSIKFTTYTLRYNRMHWITLDTLEEHWKRARIEAKLTDEGDVVISKLENITSFTLDVPAGHWPGDPTKIPNIVIDGKPVRGRSVLSDRSLKTALYLDEDTKQWAAADAVLEYPSKLAKRHGLQGPIDDAFMDSFLFVKPTGKSDHAQVQTWTESEFDRAVKHWRQQFRGDARVKNDTDVNEADIASHNLVLWGDATSNEMIRKLLPKLPLSWSATKTGIGKNSFDASSHVPVLVYPNPLNPERYIVINSSFTYREYDYLNNARQVPKLPDWAIVDLSEPPGTQRPGRIADAGFFDESWQPK